MSFAMHNGNGEGNVIVCCPLVRLRTLIRSYRKWATSSYCTNN